jgi:taurine dioxygenase
MSGLNLRPLTSVGAEVTGDWSDPIPKEIARQLYAAWLEYGVLVFPKSGTTPDIHLRLSRIFGELEIHPLVALRVKGHEELAPFGNDEKKGGGITVNGERTSGFIFVHQDTAYTPNLCKGSMLRMLHTPERGGDTLFWDTAKAYRDLPKDMKRRLESLSTVQMMRVVPPAKLWGMPGLTASPTDLESDRTRGLPEEGPLILHPMVITHPESGLKSLLLSPQGYLKIEGMEQAESDALFEEVVCHALRPEYQYRHQWSVNDMVLWDNRRMMHMATGYPYEQKRLAHRSTLKGGMEVGRYYTTPEGVSTLSAYVT